MIWWHLQIFRLNPRKKISFVYFTEKKMQEQRVWLILNKNLLLPDFLVWLAHLKKVSSHVTSSLTHKFLKIVVASFTPVELRSLRSRIAVTFCSLALLLYSENWYMFFGLAWRSVQNACFTIDSLVSNPISSSSFCCCLPSFLTDVHCIVCPKEYW